MTSKAQTCEPDRLSALLTGQLSPIDERSVEAHLDSCEACRQQLDHLAAAPDSWHAAKDFLTDDEHDRSCVTGIDDDTGISPQITQVLDVLRPTDDPTMLGRLGGYEVSGVIGAGGMGVVLKAFDGPLDRTVAVKVMAPHLATSGAARQRFAREARAAAAVIHPNVIAIHGVSTDAALPYLVMPYVGGASLQKRLDDMGPMPVAEILRIGVQIASGLSAAHDQGLVHRDIKPANILLDDGIERLVITDFGLARAVNDVSVTQTGVIAGTPQYMSPEQAQGEFVDDRSDLFSLGSVMYTMCAGRVPFRSNTPYGILRRISDNQPRPIREVNPDIPGWLCRIVERLHAKLPVDRYQSAKEVCDLLTQCLAHVSQPTVHALPQELVVDSAIRRTLPTYGTGIAAIFIGAAALAGFVVINSSDPVPEVQAPNTGAVPNVVSAPDEDVIHPSNGDSVASNAVANSDARKQVDNEQSPPLLPWEVDQTSANDWDDNLDDVFRHVEQSLQQIRAPSLTTTSFR